MDKRYINTHLAEEQIHGLIGLGDIFYKYDNYNHVLKVYIGYRPLSVNNFLYKTLTGDDAKATWIRLTEIDYIVDKFTIKDVFSVIEEMTGFDRDALRVKSRTEQLVFARQIVMWSAKKYFKNSWAMSGALVGRDHATAFFAYNKVNKDNKYLKDWQVETKIKFKKKITDIAKRNQTQNHERSN